MDNSIRIFEDVTSLRQQRNVALLEKRLVGLVPTMGALHEGHLALIRQAAKDMHEVYVSIYVNPTQFGLNEDLDKYPKTWDADMEKMIGLNKNLKDTKAKGRITTVFKPTSQVMYPNLPPTSDPNGSGSFVTITPLGSLLEGASRPVFFRGVATVCMKLFNIIQPDYVFFGQKDIQQVLVINRMIQDFHINTQLILCPIVREPDGLAFSSRNVFLGHHRRDLAPALLGALTAARNTFARGARLRDEILGPAHHIMSLVQEANRKLHPSYHIGFEVDYFSLTDPLDMQEVESVGSSRGAILSGALKMLPRSLEYVREDEDTIPVRLIDNILLDADKVLAFIRNRRGDNVVKALS